MSARPDELGLLAQGGLGAPLESSVSEDVPAISRSRGIAAGMVELTKPRLSSLVLITTAGGYVLAPGAASPWKLLLAVGGTSAVVASAQTLNCWLERDVDARMHRTRDRVLPSRRMPGWLAVLQGVVLAAAALPFLYFAVNPLSAALALLALGIYLGVYTPLKRHSSIATIVGAVPGALPPLIGWTAATGRIELPGLVLFGILFLWQIPHFLALSTFLEEDYRRGGLLVLPIDGGTTVTRGNVVLWVCALLPVSLLLVPLQVAGMAYGISAASGGAIFLGLGLWGLRPDSGRRWAVLLFAYSIVYLTVLFAMLAVDGSH